MSHRNCRVTMSWMCLKLAHWLLVLCNDIFWYMIYVIIILSLLVGLTFNARVLFMHWRFEIVNMRVNLSYHDDAPCIKRSNPQSNWSLIVFLELLSCLSYCTLKKNIQMSFKNVIVKYFVILITVAFPQIMYGDVFRRIFQTTCQHYFL